MEGLGVNRMDLFPNNRRRVPSYLYVNEDSSLGRRTRRDLSPPSFHPSPSPHGWTFDCHRPFDWPPVLDSGS